jgi:putative ABC transport system ATP-binding protein
MMALKADSVSFGYGRGNVLDGFGLEVGKGSFEALMGPSGCGKSTFFNIAAGLLLPKSGRVTVGGSTITSMGDSAAAVFRRRHMGVVFQQYNLLGERTVEENVLLPLKLDGRIDKAARIRMGELLERLALAGREKCCTKELSGGEQQRVAIARALVAEPVVVLADEPTGNLDVEAAKTVSSMLSDLAFDSKSAILMVTHDPVLAARAGKVHLLNRGRVERSFEPGGDAAAVSSLYLETYR